MQLRGDSVTIHNHSTECPACHEIASDESRARLNAEAASRAKDDFFATVSHELRGPLNAILSWAYLLRSGRLDDEMTARAIETIERNAKAEARLITDMLEVSRIVAGKIRLNWHQVDLAKLVAESVDTVRPMADGRELQVVADVATMVGTIIGDPDRLHQVLENLLLNAIKFTPKGGRITVRLGSSAKGATIIVRDTGKGIRPEFLPHVFDRFRQSDVAATRLGGLGLGLAIVQQLVALHGGTVVAASEGEGHGATFTVTLPAGPASGGVVVDASAQACSAGKENAQCTSEEV